MAQKSDVLLQILAQNKQSVAETFIYQDQRTLRLSVPNNSVITVYSFKPLSCPASTPKGNLETNASETKPIRTPATCKLSFSNETPSLAG